MIYTWLLDTLCTLKNVDNFLASFVFRRPIRNQAVLWARAQILDCAKAFLLTQK